MIRLEGTSPSQTTDVTGVNPNATEKVKTPNALTTGIAEKIQNFVRTLKDNFTSGNRTVKAQENNDVAKATEAVAEATEKISTLKQNKGSEAELKVAEAQLKVAEAEMKIANQAFKMEQLESKVAQLKESGPTEGWFKAKGELNAAQEEWKNMGCGELSEAQIELNNALEKLEAMNKNSNVDT